MIIAHLLFVVKGRMFCTIGTASTSEWFDFTYRDGSVYSFIVRGDEALFKYIVDLFLDFL